MNRQKLVDIGWWLVMAFAFCSPLLIGLMAFSPSIPTIFKNLATEAGAGWGETIFTVAAIWLGFWGIQVQKQNAEQAAFREKVEVHAVAVAFAASAEELVDSAHAGLKSGAVLLDENFEQLRSSLARLPLDKLVEPGVATAYVELERKLMFFAQTHLVAKAERTGPASAVQSITQAELDTRGLGVKSAATKIRVAVEGMRAKLYAV